MILKHLKSWKVSAGVATGVSASVVAGLLSMGHGLESRAEKLRELVDPDAAFEGATTPPNQEMLFSRLTYPTGYFNPAWVLQSIQQDRLIKSALPAGVPLVQADLAAATGLVPDGFVSLGPRPLNNTQTSFGHVSGRANALAVDPTATTDGSIVAYLGSDGGGAWTTASGTLVPGQSLQVRHTASTSHLGYTKSSIRLGGVAGSFTTRTN